jgi:hypothetical protein
MFVASHVVRLCFFLTRYQFLDASFFLNASLGCSGLIVPRPASPRAVTALTDLRDSKRYRRSVSGIVILTSLQNRRYRHGS